MVSDTASLVSAIGFHTCLLSPDFNRATVHLLPDAKQWIVYLLNMQVREPSMMCRFKSAY